LCGTVGVIPGSTLVTTSCDLREDIQNGDGIRIGTFETTVTTPRDQRTLTLNDPFEGVGGTHLKPYKIDLIAQYLEGFTPLPGCFSMLTGSNLVSTTMDVRRFIGVGEVIRLRNQDYTLIGPRTASMLVLSNKFKLRSSSAQGCERAYKRIRPWDGGLTPLTCCISTKENSDIMTTDHDLSKELKPGDSIRLRTETFRVVGVVSPQQFQVAPPSRLSSISGLRGFLQLNCTRLPGTVGVTKGDSIVTTSADLRAVLNIGDTIELGNEQFEVVLAPDRMSVVISRDWAESTVNRISMRKCLFPSDDESFGGGWGEGNDSNRDMHSASTSPIIPLSTSLRLTHGSSDGVAVLNPAIDDVGAGDRIRLCGVPYTIKSIVSGKGGGGGGGGGGGAIFQLNRPYDGTTGRCRMWRMPLSHKQRILSALAARRIQCLSLYCLAKIEEEERSVSFDMDAEMTRLPATQWTTLEGKDTMETLQEEVDKEQNAVVPAPGSASTSPSPAGMAKSGDPLTDDNKILEMPAAGPYLPAVPKSEKGNERQSSRKADTLQTFADTEHDATNDEAIDLSGFPAVEGYKEKEHNDYPAEEGIDRGAKQDIVQTANLAEKRRHRNEIVDNNDLTVETMKKSDKAAAMGNANGQDLLTDWVGELKMSKNATTTKLTNGTVET
jgi:hypothetical protein